MKNLLHFFPLIHAFVCCYLPCLPPSKSFPFPELLIPRCSARLDNPLHSILDYTFYYFYYIVIGLDGSRDEMTRKGKFSVERNKDCEKDT